MKIANIKAIETHYKGYRFRSRLEARWAVFFDTMEIEYKYEMEGFDLGNELGYYLPDFWLPQVKLWAEVKPCKFSELEFKKILELCYLTDCHGCIQLIDIPDFKGYDCWFFSGYTCENNDVVQNWKFDDQYNFIGIEDYDPECNKFRPVCNNYLQIYNGRFFESQKIKLITAYLRDEHRFYYDDEDDDEDDDFLKCDDKYASAVYAARGARFEHGELPITYQY